MKERLTRFLGVEPEETGPVALLLTISFFMGLFLATVSVGAQTLFLSDPSVNEKYDLPKVLVLGGGMGFSPQVYSTFLWDACPFGFSASYS